MPNVLRRDWTAEEYFADESTSRSDLALFELKGAATYNAIKLGDIEREHTDAMELMLASWIAACLLTSCEVYRKREAQLRQQSEVGSIIAAAMTDAEGTRCIHEISDRAWSPEQKAAWDSICTERDAATARALAAEERVRNLEHTIKVMADAAAEGDAATARMHAEHALGPAPDLSVDLDEGSPSIFWPAQDCGKCGQPVGGETIHSEGRFYHPACLGIVAGAIDPGADGGEECPF